MLIKQIILLLLCLIIISNGDKNLYYIYCALAVLFNTIIYCEYNYAIVNNNNNNNKY